MKKRGLVIGLLVMLAVITSGFTYAFWASGALGDSDTDATGTVTIGQGNAAVTTVVVGSESGVGPLVPAARLNESPEGSVGFVVLQFSVDWNSAVSGQATGLGGTLTAGVTAGTILIGGFDTYAGLVGTTVRVGAGFDVNGDAIGTPSGAITVDGDAVIVYVKVTLSEPTTLAAYQAIATYNIVFGLTFEVTPTT